AIAGISADDSGAIAATRLTIIGNSTVSGSPVGIQVSGAAALAKVVGNLASITGNVVGVDVDGGKALLQDNNLSGNSLAAIRLENGATLDAGDCGTDVTGLGTSSGGNTLTGYGFDNAAPWAIQNLNAGATPAVLAQHDNFGAVV